MNLIQIDKIFNINSETFLAIYSEFVTFLIHDNKQYIKFDNLNK